MNHPKSMFQLSGVHYSMISFRLKGSSGQAETVSNNMPHGSYHTKKKPKPYTNYQSHYITMRPMVKAIPRPLFSDIVASRLGVSENMGP